MEVSKKINTVFENYLSFLVALFYNIVYQAATGKSISYFLNFNDPMRPEREVGSIIFTIILSALTEMRKDGLLFNNIEEVKISLVKKAEASPQDMILLFALKYYHIIMLFRKAERENNIELFFTSMRLSLPFLCSTNAKEYVNIFTDILRNWHIASECEKIIIKKYSFTMKTPNRVNIGMDFGHEKYVCLSLDSTGKIFGRGSRTKVEHASLCRIDNHNNKGIKKLKL